MCKIENLWCIHYLLDLLNNPAKFQIKIFSWNFVTALTLKYGEGHWKWYEQIKLNEQYHHAKFDIYYFYGVS